MLHVMQAHTSLWFLMALICLPLLASLPLMRPESSSASRRSATAEARAAAEADHAPSVEAAVAGSASCRACDAFNSHEGFFAVVDDCQLPDKMYVSSEMMQKNVSWVRQNMPHCLMALTSSLGMARPSTFMRSELPTNTFMEQLGVIVNRSSAYVASAFAFDAAFFGDSMGVKENKRPPCANESGHARGRVELLTKLCATSPSHRDIRDVFATTPLNCRFSSLEAMAGQQREFADLESALTGRCAIGFPRQNLMHSQVQLRYEPDDIIGVLAKAPGHLPHTARLKRWLSTLMGGKHLESVLVSGGTRTEAKSCRCVDESEEAGEPSAMPVVPFEQPPQARLGTPAWRCAELPNVPCPTECGGPPINLISASSTRHIAFVHTPHTGAGYVACAAADWERMGWWTNIGGAVPQPRSGECLHHCRGGHHRALVLIVRNPYAYWWSRYQKAIACPEGINDGSDPTCVGASALTVHAANSANLSFHAFLHRATKLTDVSQSEHILRLCGKPCTYSHVLRFESLQADWIALLAQLSFPIRLLPPQTTKALHSHIQLQEHYTPELDQLVRAVEAFVFAHFRYPIGRLDLAR